MISSLALAILLSNGPVVPATFGSPGDEEVLAIVDRAWQDKAKADQKAEKDAKRHQEDLKNDVELGKKYSEQADKELKASTNQEYIDRVARIAGELALIARTTQVECTWGDKRLNPYEYNFKVVENKEVNAFSLPGGYIYVYDGLLKYVESDDELAGVLAHEISHASFRHLATLQREQSKLDIFTLPLILISILAGGSNSSGGTAGVLLGNLANQALASGWGQNAERAADYGGFQYMARSKYNPVGMLTFMEKLARDQRALESLDLGIYRTHPPSRERASAIERYILEAKLPLKRSAVATSFRVETKPDDKGGIVLQFNRRPLIKLGGDDALKRADELAPRLNDFFDSVPELYDVVLSGSTVNYRGAPLLSVTEDDAKVQGLRLDEAAQSALRSIKRELYMLAFRVWDAR